MTKTLVAPAQDQRCGGELDFCWTEPGEILVFGSRCDRGSPDDDCGCCRSFVGSKTMRGTTVGVVADVDADKLSKAADEYAAKFAGGGEKGLLWTGAIDGARASLDALASFCRGLEAGTRVGVRYEGGKHVLSVVGGEPKRYAGAQ